MAVPPNLLILLAHGLRSDVVYGTANWPEVMPNLQNRNGGKKVVGSFDRDIELTEIENLNELLVMLQAEPTQSHFPIADQKQ